MRAGESDTFLCCRRRTSRVKKQTHRSQPGIVFGWVMRIIKGLDPSLRLESPACEDQAMKWLAGPPWDWYGGIERRVKKKDDLRGDYLKDSFF